MIIRYHEFKKNERIFKRLTDLAVEEFKALEAKAEGYWIEQERVRLWRPVRQRAEGSGRQKTLLFPEQLLMTLIWLKLYLILEALGYLFGVDKSSANRYINAMLPVLRKVGAGTLGWPEPPKRGQGQSLEKVYAEHPDLYAYVDATEQRIQRSSDPATQKKEYSGKKKTHTRKTQIVVNEEGVVRDVSDSTKDPCTTVSTLLTPQSQTRSPRHCGWRRCRLPRHSRRLTQPQHDHPFQEREEASPDR